MATTTETKKRASWTQADVADLVMRSTKPGFIATDAEHAKLVELGLRLKPAKPTLSGGDKNEIDDVLDYFRAADGQPQETLRVRYAIKQLQALLPKREPKSA